MPCRYDPTPEEIRQGQEKRDKVVMDKMRKDLDRLTKEND